MTVTEICRLQGIPGDRFDFSAARVKQSSFLFAVGNAMTSTLLARVLARVLDQAGILRGDPVTAAAVKFDLTGSRTAGVDVRRAPRARAGGR
jgi:hypothetical protein